MSAHIVEGTDLELVFEKRRDDFVLRINKGGVLIFRTLLLGRLPEND